MTSESDQNLSGASVYVDFENDQKFFSLNGVEDLESCKMSNSMSSSIKALGKNSAVHCNSFKWLVQDDSQDKNSLFLHL